MVEKTEVQFTSTFGEVMEESKVIAKRLGVMNVTTAHVLLAMLEHPGSAATTVLDYLGINYDGLRKGLEERIRRTKAQGGSRLTSTSAVKGLPYRSQELAMRMKSLHTNTDHLLIAIMNIKDGPVAKALAEHKLNGNKFSQIEACVGLEARFDREE